MWELVVFIGVTSTSFASEIRYPMPSYEVCVMSMESIAMSEIKDEEKEGTVVSFCIPKID